jgi:hypothetical protein
MLRPKECHQLNFRRPQKRIYAAGQITSHCAGVANQASAPIGYQIQMLVKQEIDTW